MKLYGRETTRLANDLVSRLETELGYPIEIEVFNTQENDRGTAVRKPIGIFGNFFDKPVNVVRLKGGDKKYNHDLKILEGEYERLRGLCDLINKHKIFYYDSHEDFHRKISVKEKAFEAIRKEISGQTHLLNGKNRYTLQNIFGQGNDVQEIIKKELSKEQIISVSRFLDAAGVVHLRYNLTVSNVGCLNTEWRLIDYKEIGSDKGDNVARIIFKIKK